MKILCLLILLICLISAIAAGLHKRILPRPTSHPGKTERPERTRATTVPINRGSRTESNTVIAELSRSKRSGGSEPDKDDLLSKLDGILEHLRKFVHKLKSSGETKKPSKNSSPTTPISTPPKEFGRSKRRVRNRSDEDDDYTKALKQMLLQQILREHEKWSRRVNSFSLSSTALIIPIPSSILRPRVDRVGNRPLFTLHSFRYPALLRSREEAIAQEDMPICAPRPLSYVLILCFSILFCVLVALMFFMRATPDPPVVNLTAAYAKPTIGPFRFVPWSPHEDNIS